MKMDSLDSLGLKRFFVNILEAIAAFAGNEKATFILWLNQL